MASPSSQLQTPPRAGSEGLKHQIRIKVEDEENEEEEETEVESEQRSDHEGSCDDENEKRDNDEQSAQKQPTKNTQRRMTPTADEQKVRRGQKRKVESDDLPIYESIEEPQEEGKIRQQTASTHQAFLDEEQESRSPTGVSNSLLDSSRPRARASLSIQPSSKRVRRSTKDDVGTARCDEPEQVGWSYHERIQEIEERLEEIASHLNLFRARGSRHGGRMDAHEERISILEGEIATIKSFRHVDTRLMNRLDEIRSTDQQAPTYRLLLDSFYNHFGIHFRQLDTQCRIRPPPPEVRGAYHIRARAQLRLATDTQKQETVDRDIIEHAEYITMRWLTIPTKYYPGVQMRDRFADLYLEVCEREGMGLNYS